ncbi:hypothetical protein [Chryseobacterium sp. JV558]|uniref:hypothetical protein n=1 Tax=Chryseobacterium sp. JV558 TaxID=2663236 RepID=UPI00299DFB84|nr:hypothetical protein [Chryseobacterium sp. JV558]MDW9381400.1 hypothetical protein [Chryseobacterium sp. JV558]
MNHITGSFSTSGFGSFYSYKYNSKELQENGMYDYGARMYIPDLGIWGAGDPAGVFDIGGQVMSNWLPPKKIGILQWLLEL